MRNARFLTMVAMILGLTCAVLAAGPSAINYQGVLRDASGNPLDGNYNMRFRFYDDETAGFLLLTDFHALASGGSVTVDGGLFNVELGTGTLTPSSVTLESVFRGNDEVWMEIQIGLEFLSPRIRVVSAAYAMNAASLDGKAAGDFIDTSAVDQNKLGSLTVDSLSLTGGSIQGSGPLLFKAGDDNYVFGESTDPRALIYPWGDLDLAGNLRLNADGSTGNTTINFLSGTADEYFYWNASTELFQLTDDLYVDGALRVAASTGTGFNAFGSGLPDSGAMNLKNDVFVGGAIEVNDTLFADGGIDVSGSFDTDDDSIWFDNGTETMYWHEATTHFHFSDDLFIQSGVLHVGGTTGTEPYNHFGTGVAVRPEISSYTDAYVAGDVEVGGTLFADGPVKGPLGGQLFIASDSNIYLDANAELITIIDGDNSPSPREVEWYRNIPVNSTKLMVLQESGNLFLRGTIFVNQNFDLAESFIAAEPVDAGDLVRLDPAWPGAVRRTDGFGDPLVLGVVSEAPGVTLGGASFDPAALREAWGDAIADEFEARRQHFREEVLEQDAELRSNLETVEARIEQIEQIEPDEAPVEPMQISNEHHEGEDGSPVELDDPVADLERSESKRQELEQEIEWLSLQRFHEERFAPIALAGRVPVKVDTSSGSILPGDSLMPGPTPGVAVKADGSGPVIGTALEGLSAGTGRVMVFVQRGGTVAPQAIEAARAEFVEALEDRTPDPATGRQTMPQDLQVVLDREADDEARFSIFRDGETEGALGAEVFRVDEAGNVFAKGAFRPASMDVAEFFELSEPAEPGDVLVVDRESHGLCRPSTEPEDPAVIGVVAAAPGVLLGGELSRIAAVDAELATALDEARSRGERELEQELWRELEGRFLKTHAAVALTGTVAVKVDAGYGVIAPGDPLTTSPTRGHAMRAVDGTAYTTIGKALEGLEEGTGRIRMLVMLR